jgi:hypothetical protein
VLCDAIVIVLRGLQWVPRPCSSSSPFNLAAHLLVKRVLVQDRRTFDVWYVLPNAPRFADWNKWLPGQDSNRVNDRSGETLSG